MTAQELKNSILQLAVQGKLVPQCKEDEPASELMKHISAEKAKLGIKEKSLADITNDEIPFDIPDSWEWVKLGKICRVSTGKKDANFGNENGKYYFFTCAKEPIRCNSFSFEGESILIAGNGDISNISYYDGQFEAYQRTYILQPYIEHSYLYYLLFHIQSNWVKYNIDKMFGSAIPYIRLGNVQNYMVALPPLAEQERIVAKIEELMPLVEEYGKAEEQLTKLNAEFPDKLRKSILQQAVQGKLTERDPADEPASELIKRIKTEKEALMKSGKIKKEKPLPEITEDEKPFDIPEQWCSVRIGDVGIYKKGPFGSSLTKSMFVPKSLDAVKVYEQKNAIQKDHTLGEYYIARDYFEKKMRGFEIFPGDIIVSCAGTIGETYVMPENIEQGIINQALMRMKIVPSIDLDYFLLYFDYVLKIDAQGSSKGSAIKNIPPFEIFKKMILPLPPLAEQKRIVKRVEELLALCNELK